jgi:hypothetical protein
LISFKPLWLWQAKQIRRQASKLPLDGKNALPFLLGQTRQAPENLYLFFDKVFANGALGQVENSRGALEHPALHGGSGQQKEQQAQPSRSCSI